MQIKREQVDPTKVKLTITADQKAIDEVKRLVLSKLGKNVKVPGFRPGKTPDNIIEKNIDQSVLQTEFLDQAVNQFYVHAIEQESLRPAAQPEIAISKFVPFSTLEFTAELEAVGDIQLPDYKMIKHPAPKVEVTADEVKEVLGRLSQRAAEKSEVTRAAKKTDEVTIDFSGVDTKTKEIIEGTDGKDYPLVIGSNSFIPGFEEELVGLKTGDDKTFTITFPKDYGAASLQKRKVDFKVKVSKIQELKEPKLDDAFAKTVGPFESLAQLKADVKKQLEGEKRQEAERKYDNELLEKIAAKTDVAVPKALVEEEIDRIEEEEKRNIVYRGQTWQEHLDEEKVTAEEHREKQRDAAELRVKAGLILGEISQAEQIKVNDDELDQQIQLLRAQYPDPTMQAELDKPDNRRDILSRMMTQKTLTKLREYATAK